MGRLIKSHQRYGLIMDPLTHSPTVANRYPSSLDIIKNIISSDKSHYSSNCIPRYYQHILYVRTYRVVSRSGTFNLPRRTGILSYQKRIMKMAHSTSYPLNVCLPSRANASPYIAKSAFFVRPSPRTFLFLLFSTARKRPC